MRVLRHKQDALSAGATTLKLKNVCTHAEQVSCTCSRSNDIEKLKTFPLTIDTLAFVTDNTE